MISINIDHRRGYYITDSIDKKIGLKTDFNIG